MVTFVCPGVDRSSRCLRTVVGLAMGVACLIATGGSSPKAAAADDRYGIHWILRTPTYTFNSAGRNQYAKFVVTDGVYSGEGGPYHLDVLYASFHSRWRVGRSSFQESERYELPLDGDGNRNDFRHSQRTGRAQLRVRVPSYGLRVDLRFATQRIRQSTCQGGHTVASGVVSGTL